MTEAAAILLVSDALLALRPDCAPTPETELLTGLLTSLDLVTLLVDLEDDLVEAGLPRIWLADAQAMSRRHSPFRTVRTLAAFIVERLDA